jgi:tRNA(Ile)-lysidine synthase
MRAARWSFFWRSAQNGVPILTGHHQDDWLETVLLKMLRGASVQGVTAFQVWNGKILRPLLEVSRVELFHYVTKKKVEFSEDPSNQEDVYLRNWLRNDWLRSLEVKSPGSVGHLAQSLRGMVVELQRSEHEFQLQYHGCDLSQGLSRSWYLSLSQNDQLSALASYLKAHQIRDFTRGQLEEIKKRLDKNQKDLTFTILDRKWVINATQIMLE